TIPLQPGVQCTKNRVTMPSTYSWSFTLFHVTPVFLANCMMISSMVYLPLPSARIASRTAASNLACFSMGRGAGGTGEGVCSVGSAGLLAFLPPERISCRYTTLLLALLYNSQEFLTMARICPASFP